jgi:MYXO-CTERM domain-containing protein
MMRTAVSVAAIAALAGAASAQVVYTDAVGDTFFGGILDIVQVEVSNTLDDITFVITLDGDVEATDWGKYMVIIDSGAGGDTAGNGWARPIGMASGANSWLGSWVDSGNGLEAYSWNGASWQLDGATYNATPGLSISKSGNTVTLTAPLALLGIVVGQDIEFDVFTSGGGGGDGAIDSLGNPNQQVGDWGDFSNAFPLVYTVVPAPGAIALGMLGVAGLASRRRR